MAHTEKNKFDFSTTWGDSDPVGLNVENGNAADYKNDAPVVPDGIFSGSKGGPYRSNSKFDAGGTFGDSDPFNGNDNAVDFSQDSAGVPNVNQGEQTDMDMNLAPNMFPRETGHDSLTDEEAQLS